MSSRSRRKDAPPKGLHRRLWWILRHDVGRKLLALMLAVLVWLKLSSMVSNDLPITDLPVIVAMSRSDATKQMQTTSAVYLVVPRDVLVRTDLSSTKVKLTGRGLKEEIEGIKFSAILEIGDDVLGDDDERTWTTSLDERALFESRSGFEPEIKEFKVEPETLTLLLARKGEAEFRLEPLNVRIKGSPKDGYAYDRENILVHPNRVTLTGPRSQIEELQRDQTALRLAEVDVEGALFEVSQQVGIDVTRVDRSVTLDTVGGVVEVTVPIRPKDITRDLLSVAVEYKNADALAARGLKIREATPAVDLKITGPRSVLAGLNSEELSKRIQLQFDWGNAQLPLASARISVWRKDLPEDPVVRITDREGDPPMIRYQLDEVPAGSPPPPTGGGDTP